ncbi:ubiquitin-associated domain-containing protein 1 [Scaptodrosophila lebanonensis]|uniref:Ubiquitin-associated domain-containing protein 1 n=1 Tax=Drosophila lebanonensis TaxID=7225 RepID=A0A6J2U0W7_DROLE|nr:ubiquitin-associated domain-containing protein 1 [Scaptodrosophila lebanonensis]
MIPWMREKFNEKRAKWAARYKRPLPGQPNEGSSVSDADSASISMGSRQSSRLAVHTTETETQTDGVGIDGCILGTPLSSPALQRRPLIETPTHVPTRPLYTKQANDLFLRKNAARLASAPSTGADVETLKPGESITVRVICPSSRVLIFRTDVNKRLSDLKSEVILELSDDPESIQLFAPDVRHLNPRYRLFRAEYFGSELNESDTLAQLQVLNNETFILAPRRNTLTQTAARTREVPGPNEALLESATRYVPNNTSLLPVIDINEIFQQSNIQYDVRKVLISLAQASAAILGAGPFAPRLIAMLKQRLINRRNHHADTLQCLVDMGFKRELAEYALKANNGIYSTTLEWLIQNQNEDASKEPPAMSMQQSSSSISPSTIVTNNETIENTAALMEIVRIYSHREVPPSEEIVESLTEMGFEESTVIAALKKTGNNKASACEWLCDNRSGSVTELREGLSPDSPILKVILEMPQVQMTLNNPKTFLAFLAILENEQAIRVWRGDNDTTSVITHILQKYHEEKHVLGINQFYVNRW